MKTASDLWDKILAASFLKKLIMGYTSDPLPMNERTPQQRAHAKSRRRMQRESRRRNRSNWY